jgi:ribosomal protein L11 methyltransferase
MGYLELTFNVPEDELTSEILASQLLEIGCDSFLEDEPGLFKAYIEDAFYSEAVLNELLQDEALQNVSLLKLAPLPDQNWNATWEASYDPVIINDKCRIRAPFHQRDPAYKFDLVIEPKMSFGTAHHETTFQMLNQLFDVDFHHKNVLDIGSGTAVLAILAKKLGAVNVVAIDNDQWAYNNACDNIKLNDEASIIVELGDATSINQRTFDVILANINRNILINDMVHYASALLIGGELLLSGFYTEDLDSIKAVATQNKLAYKKHRVKNNWVVAVFSKQA